MKKYYSLLLIAILSCFSITTFAGKDFYTIVYDAGSTGTRFHLFHVVTGKPLIPEISEVVLKKTDGTSYNSAALSSFSNNPQLAGASLKPSLDAVSTALPYKKITVHVLATAGMRLLPKQTQEAIYGNITRYIKTNYPYFILKQARTIEGSEEALYGWLSINYLSDTLKKKIATLGNIDIGGASAEIAFETNGTKGFNSDIKLIKIGKRTYRVFSKSFLGLGADESRNAISYDTTTNTINSSVSSCFPSGYQDVIKSNDETVLGTVTGQFNQMNCEALYSNLLEKDQVKKQTPSLEGQKFIAHSSVDYTYQFFGAEANPDEAFLESQIQTTCSKTSDELAKQYPKVPAKYLFVYCATGVYLDELLYDTWGLQASQLIIENQINNHDLDWTLGAVFYEATQTNGKQ